MKVYSEFVGELTKWYQRNSIVENIQPLVDDYQSTEFQQDSGIKVSQDIEQWLLDDLQCEIGETPCVPSIAAYDMAYCLLPPSGMLSAAQMMRLGRSEGSPRGHYCSQVRGVAYSESWIPFASDGGGSYYAIDFSPAEQGHFGQVILIADSNCYFISDDVPGFFERLTAGFRTNLYQYEEDSGPFKIHDSDFPTHSPCTT